MCNSSLGSLARMVRPIINASSNKTNIEGRGTIPTYTQPPSLSAERDLILAWPPFSPNNESVSVAPACVGCKPGLRSKSALGVTSIAQLVSSRADAPILVPDTWHFRCRLHHRSLGFGNAPVRTRALRLGPRCSGMPPVPHIRPQLTTGRHAPQKHSRSSP